VTRAPELLEISGKRAPINKSVLAPPFVRGSSGFKPEPQNPSATAATSLTPYPVISNLIFLISMGLLTPTPVDS
jgi:hypothetical protein